MIIYELRTTISRVEDLVTQAEIFGRTCAPALEFDDPKAGANTCPCCGRPLVTSAVIYTARRKSFADLCNRRPCGSRFSRLPGRDGSGSRGTTIVLFHRGCGRDNHSARCTWKSDYKWLATVERTTSGSSPPCGFERCWWPLLRVGLAAGGDDQAHPRHGER